MSSFISSGKAYKVLGVAVLGLGYIPSFSSCFFQSSSRCKPCEVKIAQSLSTNELTKQTNGLFEFLDTKPASVKNDISLDSADNALCSAILELHQSELLASCNDKALSKSSVKSEKSSNATLVANNAITTITTGKFAGCRLAKGVVNSNFYVEIMRLGVPASVVNSMIKNLSSKINFRRALKAGNTFEVIFDNKKMMYCHFEAGKHNKIKASVYGVEEHGKMVYCFENGTKVVQPTSKTFGKPLAGSMVVSSPYGMRVHPIKKVRCYHSGVDLVAQYGSPVYAISDGVVMRASKYSGYGNCVEIGHASGYKSLYGHLSRYAVRCGSRVKKGQVIGYTGSSGVSTGPHLHLELARYNKVLNPFSVKMLPNENGKICNIKALNEMKNQVSRVLAKKK